jgi:hypothetical protein
VSQRHAEFSVQGYSIVPEIFDRSEVKALRQLANGLVTRHRSGDPKVLAATLSIAAAYRMQPERNPGIEPAHWEREPFIISDLIALEPGLATLFANERMWHSVAEMLQCSVVDVAFHFCNLTRKPPTAGPAISWHRDAKNTYFTVEDGRTLRLLIPLQSMSASNGGTGVVPGSHLVKSDSIDDAIWPTVFAGTGLAIHSATLHGSSPNRSEQERDIIVIQFGWSRSCLRSRAQDVLSLASLDDFHVFAQDLIPYESGSD